MDMRTLDAAKLILDSLRANGVKDEELVRMLFEIQRSDIEIPVSVLSDRRLGALESITIFLKDNKQLSYHEIAVLLKRDDRTIWATYNKAKRKLEYEQIL